MTRPMLQLLALLAVVSLGFLGGGRYAAAAPLRPSTRDPFLEEVQRRAFRFFWEATDPKTGLTKDRARNFEADNFDIGSIASTGFALAALPIGVEHGWVSRDAARARALLTLRFFEKRAPVLHGLYPHFLKFGSGERAWNSEYSTIDTTLLLAGALTAGEYFGGEVKARAERLSARVEWTYWTPRHFVAHGSRPEEGQFLGADYGGYSEALLLYILAIGSPTHPVPAALWHELGRDFRRYGPYSLIAGSSLFVNQYPNLWVDFAGWQDGAADYAQNLRANTLANRLYGETLADRFEGFGPDVWGLTAGDGPDGYMAFGAMPGLAWVDGTINPHAPGGSFQATPDVSRRALRAMLDRYRSRIWGRYGFSDGFNPGRNWWDTDVVGIDTGATLLSIENARTGLIQRLFMREPLVRTAMQRIGMRKVPAGPQPLRAAGLIQVPSDRAMPVSFTLPPAPPAGWKDVPLLLYGGIAEGPLTVTLNGKSLGRSPEGPGLATSAAFPIPPGLLKWGGANTLTLQAAGKETMTYGPIVLGPRAALEWKPLAIVDVESVPAG